MAALQIFALLIEVVAVIAAVILGGKAGLIVALVAASVAIALRRGRWFERRDGDRPAAWSALGGAIAGATALGVAWLLSPAIVDATGHSVEWTTDPIVRGSAQLAATVALVTIALDVAAELVFRRWLLERIAAAVRADGNPRHLALAAGLVGAAAIEAMVSPGGGGRVGILAVSGGLGCLYLASGGRLAASLAARLIFDVGAILLQALRLTA